MGRELVDKGIAVGQSVQASHMVKVFCLVRDGMGLPVIHHLQPVLGCAQQCVSVRQGSRIGWINPPRRRQGGQSLPCIGHPQSRITPAVDQLMGLCVKLTFAYPAAPAFQIIAKAQHLTA